MQAHHDRVAGLHVLDGTLVGAEHLGAVDPDLARAPTRTVGRLEGLVVEHVDEVLVDDLDRGPDGHEPAVLEQHDLVAEVPHRVHRVRDHDDRAALLLELDELLGAPALELLVADREHLVDQEHIGIDVDRDREPEADVHARRVVLDRCVDEAPDAGERDDLVEPLIHLRFDKPRIAPLRYTLSRPESSGWNPAPSSSSAEIFPRVVIVPASGLRILAMHFSSVLLPEPFSPMRPSVTPSGTSKLTSSKARKSSYCARRRAAPQP